LGRERKRKCLVIDSDVDTVSGGGVVDFGASSHERRRRRGFFSCTSIAVVFIMVWAFGEKAQKGSEAFSTGGLGYVFDFSMYNTIMFIPDQLRFLVKLHYSLT
jgi:hypothetical protein